MSDGFQLGVSLRRLGRKRARLLKDGADPLCVHPRSIQSLIDFETGRTRSFPGQTPAPEKLRRCLEEVAGAAIPPDSLNRETLVWINTLLHGGKPSEWLRSRSIDPICPAHQPFPVEGIDRALNRLFQWLSSEGFRQLHPIEQAAIAQIRLQEICPFEHFALCTSTIFSYTTLLARQFPLPLLGITHCSTYTRSLCEGFAFSTLPLVTLLIEACERAYGVSGDLNVLG